MYLSDPLPQVAEVPEGTEPSDAMPAPADSEAAKVEEDHAAASNTSGVNEDSSLNKDTVAASAEPAVEPVVGEATDPAEGQAAKPEEMAASDVRPDQLVADDVPETQAHSKDAGTETKPAAPAETATESQTAAEATPDTGQTESGGTNANTPDAQAASGKQADIPAEVAETPEKASNAEPTVAAVQGTATAPEQEQSDAKRNLQQAALPKVVAPDHDSLPLWQRNRQRIDRRWLKDSAGNPKPRIAFILSELGLAPKAAEEIIKKLPPAITLSFSPYAKPQTLEYLSALARSNGHEVMLDLPLEPIDFPQRDPGPKALLTALEPEENLERLGWSLGRSTGYVGVAVWMGSRFVGSPRQMQPLMEAIQTEGLVYLDNAEREDSLGPGLASELGIPTVTSHRYVDVPLASRDAIDARLAQVERIALQFGSAVAMGRPFPVTVERLAEWSAEIEKRGIILVPITVLAEDAARRQNLAEKPGEKKSKTKSTDSEAQ